MRETDVGFNPLMRRAEAVASTSLYRVAVVGLRVIRQLKRDRRTIALVLFAPLVVMALFGYAISGEMSGVRLAIVENGGGEIQRGITDQIEANDAFRISHLASESDAEKLTAQRRLHGAVILEDDEIRVLLDGASPQIASLILAQVEAGIRAGVGDALDSQKDRRGISGSGVVSGRLQGDDLPGITIPEVTPRYVRGYDIDVIDSVGPAVVGLVVFFFTFLITTVSFLRERTLGTMEKFLVSPLSRIEMVLGYVAGFTIYTFVQSAISLFLVVALFGVPIKGSPIDCLAVLMLLGVGALCLGALFSNFARTEFQVVQFIPMVILPQVVLTGVWWPLESVPSFIRPVSYLFPLTYCNDAMRAIMLRGASLSDVLVPDILAMGIFMAAAFALATLMLKREVA